MLKWEKKNRVRASKLLEVRTACRILLLQRKQREPEGDIRGLSKELLLLVMDNENLVN
jgi:hypothetical protein